MSPLSIHSMPIKSLSLLSLRYLCFSNTLNSGIKILACSNGEQWCPLAACAGSICTLLYRCNLIIFKYELLLGTGIIT